MSEMSQGEHHYLNDWNRGRLIAQRGGGIDEGMRRLLRHLRRTLDSTSKSDTVRRPRSLDWGLVRRDDRAVDSSGRRMADLHEDTLRCVFWRTAGSLGHNEVPFSSGIPTR
jgi:hypothetical protein